MRLDIVNRNGIAANIKPTNITETILNFNRLSIIYTILFPLQPSLVRLKREIISAIYNINNKYCPLK